MGIDTGTRVIGLLGLLVVGGIGAQAMGYIPDTRETFLDRAAADDNVMLVASKDPAMATEVQSARATLPAFLEAARTQPPGWTSVSLKARLEGKSTFENIWIAEFELMPDGNVRGRVANTPVDLPGLSLGDEILFGADKVVDWAFISGGRGYGFYSVRALLPDMDAEQRAGMQAFLSDTPVPAVWPGATPAAAAAPALEKSESISRGFEMLRLSLGMGPRTAG